MTNVATLYPAHLQTMMQRHDRALGETGLDHVMIYGGAQHMIFLDDMPYSFKMNPHLESWVPVVDNPNCFLLYTPGAKPRLLFHQPVDYWHKPAAAPVGPWVEHVEVELIADPVEARRSVPARGRTAFLGEWDESFAEWGFSEANPQPLLDRLHFERAWKTAYEIECMRIANSIGADGHRAAERVFREGGSEYEIHQAYLMATRHNEADLPYGNIIALNENAAVLHYQHQERSRPEDAVSFLIDAGASFNGYASDITRTWARDEDSEFQKLIESMDKAQLELCSEVRPGLDYRDLHLLAHRKIAELLRELRFVDLDAEAIVERRISSAFFPHGVGHYIGLQVHDVGGFMADRTGETIPKPEGHPFLRLTRVVEEGQVFTIEPGLYFIDSLLSELRKSAEAKHVDWQRVDSFRRYGGIRIEDDVVVTADGHENLTRAAFG
ncbi:MAG TPA: Xaa-Pro dipeptidase [Thermoanaerobaculia bacterium]|nr:Xaa-Pro dipeptidase [Thermoanaerobaculia bacterium]